MSSQPVAALLDEARTMVDAELAARLPAAEDVLSQAMRYAALGSGKRVRPALLFAVARSLDLEIAGVVAPAAAIEMVHAFSLVHDDLPALDDDDLRRGRETLHVAFDEATAILAGDALLNLAFDVLTEAPESASAEQRCQAVAAVSRAVGANGMIGGQMLDLRRDDHASTVDQLEHIHRRKTGALMRACGELAAIYADVDRATAADAATCCEAIGLMFQIRDDLLDVTQESEVLGKTSGKDEAQDKLTYPALLGVDGAVRRLESLHARVLDCLADLPGDTAPLAALVDFVADRQH